MTRLTRGGHAALARASPMCHSAHAANDKGGHMNFIASLGAGRVIF